MNAEIKPPSLKNDMITLAHGGGGKAMRELIEHVFIPAFEPDGLEDQARLTHHDLQILGAKLAFTTDGFVVDPLEFPGGDIGKIAVCGTVNDLAVGGAKPLWLSASFIIEEGFSLSTLKRIVASMRDAAKEAGVRIVTGDTKVVNKGSADGLFITTSGVGVIAPSIDLSARNIREGDCILVNGQLGNHGAAIMAARGDMALEAAIKSDCQPLNHLMQAVLKVAPNVRMARDATRGGVASTLCEMALESGLGIEIDETLLPIDPQVRGLCEILGLEPLYLANEGALVMIVAPEEAAATLEAMRASGYGAHAALIGRVVSGHPKRVVMNTAFGGGRIVDMLVGDQLPRIC